MQFIDGSLLSTFLNEIILPVIVAIIALIIEHRSGLSQSGEMGLTFPSVVWRYFFAFSLSYASFIFLYSTSSFIEKAYNSANLVFSEDNKPLAVVLTYAIFVVPIIVNFITNIYVPPKKHISVTIPGSLVGISLILTFGNLLIALISWAFLLFIMGSYPISKELETEINASSLYEFMKYRLSGNAEVILYTNYAYSFLFFVLCSAMSLTVFLIVCSEFSDEYKKQD